MIPALILGLLFVPGLVVAPVLFEVADSRHLAGQLAGGIFHVSNSGLWHGVSAFLHFAAMLMSATIVAFGFSGKRACK